MDRDGPEAGTSKHEMSRPPIMNVVLFDRVPIKVAERPALTVPASVHRMGGLEDLGLDTHLVLDFARRLHPYVAAASVAPLILALALRRRPMALAALATTAAFDGNPPAHGERLRVLSTNLSVGQADTTSLMNLVRTVRPGGRRVRGRGRLRDVPPSPRPGRGQGLSLDIGRVAVAAAQEVHFGVHSLPGTDHRPIVVVLRLP